MATLVRLWNYITISPIIGKNPPLDKGFRVLLPKLLRRSAPLLGPSTSHHVPPRAGAKNGSNLFQSGRPHSNRVKLLAADANTIWTRRCSIRYVFQKRYCACLCHFGVAFLASPHWCDLCREVDINPRFEPRSPMCQLSISSTNGQ